AALADGFVDLMNAANLPSLGLIAGTGNGGGLGRQFSAFFYETLGRYRAKTIFQKDADGNYILKNGTPVVDESKSWRTPFDGFREKEIVAMNGIMNSLDEAIVNGAMQTGAEEYL